METPSSTRRVTRSQTLATSGNNNCSSSLLSRKVDEPEKSMSKSMQTSAKKQQPKEQRSALVDITNDSPIVGLAMGSLETPTSGVSKKRMSSSQVVARTPGSGEALLRGQVKTLLQKVEEEAELSKITLENRRLFSLVKVNSPMISLVAPTPANTPQVDGFTPSVIPSPVVNEKFLIPEMVGEMFHVKKQVETEEEVIITRSLLRDFSDRSESSSDSLSVKKLQRNATLFGGEDTESSTEKLPAGDDDDASIWSVQVNTSSSIRDDGEEEDEEEYEEDESFHEEEGEEYDEEGGDSSDGVLMLDELCEGMSKVSVNEAGAKFMGKHIRFAYNSDDELEGEFESPQPLSGGALHLKGLPPTLKGEASPFS